MSDINQLAGTEFTERIHLHSTELPMESNNYQGTMTKELITSCDDLINKDEVSQE